LTEGVLLRLLLLKVLRLLEGVLLRLTEDELLRLLLLKLLRLLDGELLRLKLLPLLWLPPPRLMLDDDVWLPPPPPLRPPPPRWAYTGVSASARPRIARLAKRDIFMMNSFLFIVLFTIPVGCCPWEGFFSFSTMQRYNHSPRENPLPSPIFPDAALNARN